MHWVVDAEHLEGNKLLLTFENGVRKVVDLEPHLEGEIFEPLQDREYFQQVYVNEDTETIEWPNGADLAPEFLWEIGEEIEAVQSVSVR